MWVQGNVQRQTHCLPPDGHELQQQPVGPAEFGAPERGAMRFFDGGGAEVTRFDRQAHFWEGGFDLAQVEVFVAEESHGAMLDHGTSARHYKQTGRIILPINAYINLTKFIISNKLNRALI